MANVPIKLESLIDVGNVMVRALSEKELIDQFLQCNTNYSTCWVSYWVEATGYDFQPAVVLSWCHNGNDYPNMTAADANTILQKYD